MTERTQRTQRRETQRSQPSARAGGLGSAPAACLCVLCVERKLRSATRSPSPTSRRLREVTDPQLSPDGEWVAYAVSAVDTVRDQDDTDIWMTSWDGARSVRLTHSQAE